MEKSLNILLIDDEASIRHLFQETLQNAGYSCITSIDGHMGFQEIRWMDFDLVITDLKMPDWDGITTIRNVSLLNPELKFMVISGYLDRYASELDACENVISYHRKPIDINDFIQHVDDWFESQKIQQQ